MSAQIFCHNTTLLIHTSIFMIHQPLFILDAQIHLEHASKNRNQFCVWIQCFIIMWVHKYCATTLPSVISTILPQYYLIICFLPLHASLFIIHQALFILDAQIHIEHVPKDRNQICAWISVAWFFKWTNILLWHGGASSWFTRVHHINSQPWFYTVSAQIFYHNTLLSNVFHRCTHQYLSFTNLCLFWIYKYI
jgi:hypothetical protein